MAANQYYDLGVEKFLQKELDLEDDTIKVVACTSAYTRNLATHEFLSDVTAAARKSTSVALTSKTVSGRNFDHADFELPSVPNGETITQLVWYRDTGTESTSPLIFSTTSATGLPLTGNGGNVSVKLNASGLVEIDPAAA